MAVATRGLLLPYPRLEIVSVSYIQHAVTGRPLVVQPRSGYSKPEPGSVTFSHKRFPLTSLPVNRVAPFSTGRSKNGRGSKACSEVLSEILFH